MSSPVDQINEAGGLSAASAAATVAPNGDQKRSCTNDAPDEPEGKKRRVEEAEEDAKPPAAERCYICFDLRSDDGELPVRDCSCRGGAGFAHKSCIIQYAKMSHDDRGPVNFIDLWRRCPQCKQRYQGDLTVDLANEAVAFVEGRAPASRAQHLCEQLVALSHNLTAVRGRDREVESTANKILSVVDEMKTVANASLFDVITMAAEAGAFMSLGLLALDRKSKSGAEAAVEYLEKARDRYEEVEMEEAVVAVDMAMDAAKRLLEGGQNVGTEDQAKRIERLYEDSKAKKGEDNADTISLGSSLAVVYHKTGDQIKAERLFAKLIDSSKRVHGEDHGVTREAMSDLQKCKTRHVAVVDGSEVIDFQALRYEEDGAKCIVQGPVEEPRNIDEEKTLTVSTKDVFCIEGTPVVCHCAGYMTRAKREIEGKIGVAECLDVKRDCYEVRFEDDDLATRWVKRESVRILFELPCEEAEP